MADDGITEDVRAFIADYLNSVEQLEIVLLLRRTQPQEWTPETTSRELYISPESAARRLADFEERRLFTVRAVGTELWYRYNPRIPDLDRTIQGLATAYEERRVRVINPIFSKPVDHVRSFADAFRIRKDKDED